MEAKLVVVGGKANMGEVKLRLPMTIGRGRKADLIISHPTVSRIHCELYEVDGSLIVRDNGSSNGTFIDDKQIKEAVVEPGHILKIGPLTFRAEYEWAGNAPSLDALAEGRALAATQTMTADELFGDEEPPSVATSPPSKPPLKQPEKKSPPPAAAKAKPVAAPAKSQAPAASPAAKQPAAPPPAEKDDFDFMADIEFVDDGAKAEPVRGPHETLDEAAEAGAAPEVAAAADSVPDAGVDFLDDLGLNEPVETSPEVESHEPTAETVAAPPSPAATTDEPGFDFLSDLDARTPVEPAAEAEPLETPPAEEPAPAEPPVEELAATLPPTVEPATPKGSAEELAFDFLNELESPAPSEEVPAAELDVAQPVAAAPSIETEPVPEPSAEQEPAPEIAVTSAFDFAVETGPAKLPAAPSFDFLDAPEPAVSEPAAAVTEPTGETPPADDEALFDMFSVETAPAGEAAPPPAPAVAENETPPESASPWNFDLPAESAPETTQPFAPPTPPDAEAAAPSHADEASSPAPEAEPTVDFRPGDDESVGEPAFAFGPPVEETPPAEPESVEPEPAFALGENTAAAPIVAPSAKSPLPTPAKKLSFVDKLKLLFAGSGKKAKGPPVKQAAKPSIAPTDEPAAAGAGPFVPMFSPSPPANDPIPLADDLLSPPAEAAAPAEPAALSSPAEIAFDELAVEPPAASPEPAALAPPAEEEPEPFDFEAGLFEKSETPPAAEAFEPPPVETVAPLAEIAPATEIAPDFAMDAAPAAATNEEFDFGEPFDEPPATVPAASASTESARTPDELDLPPDEAAVESQSVAASAAPEPAVAGDAERPPFFDEAAAEPTPTVETDAAEALFAAESEPATSAESPEIESPEAEMPVAAAPAEPVGVTPTPAVTPSRRNHLVDVDARLSSSHRMVARVTVRAPQVDVPHMEPEAPSGRNFERTGRVATRVVVRQTVAEETPPVAPLATAAVAPLETLPLEPASVEPTIDELAFFESDVVDATSPPDVGSPLDESSSDADVAVIAPVETAPLETVPPAADVAAKPKQQADDELDRFLDDLGMG